MGLWDREDTPTKASLWDSNPKPKASLWDNSPKSAPRETTAATGGAALTSEYDEMARGPSGYSAQARAEAKTALSNERDWEIYRNTSAAILGTAASALVPPFNFGPSMLARSAASATTAASGTALYRGIHDPIAGSESDPTADIGISAAIGAALPPAAAGAVGLIKKSASKFYQALGNLSETMGENVLPRSIRRIAADAPTLMSARDRATAEMRGDAARAAFRELIPEGQTRETAGEVVFARAKAAARKAAFQYGRGPITMEADPELAMEMANSSIWDTINRTGWGHAALKAGSDVRELTRYWVRNTADYLKTNVEKFKGLGPKLAQQFEMAELIGDQHIGEASTWAEDNIVRGLNKADRLHLDDVIRGKAVPKNEDIARRALNWRRLANSTFKQGNEVGLRQLVPPTHGRGQTELFDEVVQSSRELANPATDWQPAPLQYRENYAPAIRDRRAMRLLSTPGSKEREAALKHIVDTRKISPSKAAEILDNITGPRGAWEFDHSFQYAREDLLDELKIPFQRDPKIWMQQWANVTGRRLARAQVWGPQDELMEQQIGQLKDMGGDNRLLNSMYSAFIGHQQPFRGDELSKWAGTAMTVTALRPSVSILQHLQLSNTIAKFGFKNTIKALYLAANDPELARFVNRSGALLPSQNMSWIQDELHDVGTNWVKLIGMQSQDKFERIIAAHAAGQAAVEHAENYVKLGGEGWRARNIERQLLQLGIDPRAVQNQGGKLTMQQVQSAMLQGANEAQFPTHFTDMPAAWRTTALGKWSFKFRTFIKQQTNYINKSLLAEARHGNVAPLARYLGTYGGLYAMAQPLLDFVNGTTREEGMDTYEAAMDKLQTYAYAGMLGGYGDAINLVRNSTAGRVAGTLFGPFIGNTLLDLEGVHQSITNEDWGPSSPAALRAYSHVPLVGGQLRRYAQENW